MGTPLAIDLIADVVCPWCYIGWKRLQKAVALRPDIDATITWRPFQLDATIPDEGLDRKNYMAAKFAGASPEKREAMMAALQENAARDGLTLNLTDIPISPNTNAAQRLIRWAQEMGVGPAVIEGVMAAYFTDLRDIGDPVVLSEIGAEAGMDPLMILGRLSEEVDKDQVTREYIQAANAGVSGVPFYIFGGRTAVSGAETPENIALAMDKAVELAA
ncbi:MAG: oxidoreductase [Caulobacter sp.]|nr:oxidoreductase [Caulobacter sp.]